MSIKQVEIRAFSGPESVELDGIDQPHVVQINQGPAGPAGSGVPAGGTEGQILAKATDTSYDTEWIDNFATSLSATVRNETGATLTKGTVVYINGGSGNKPTVTKASASSEATSSKTFAILSEDIDHQQNGQAVTMGLLKQVNTNGMAPGANLWLSTTPGVYTTTMPTAPDHAVFLGNVVRVSSTVGEIEVRIQNGYELGELHNVSVAGAVGGDTLRYDSDAGLWRHESPTSDSQPNTIVARNVSGQFEASGITFVYPGDTSYGNALLSDHDGSVEPTPVFSNYLPLGAGRLLLDAANLSDLSDLATARTNLGLGTTDSPTFKDLTIATGTITTSNPVEVTQTWNAAGVTFTGLKFNATDTASASGSLLMDLQVGGSSKFSVSKGGRVFCDMVGASVLSNFSGVLFSPSSHTHYASNSIQFTVASGYVSFGGGTNTRLYSDSDNQLAQRNGTNAQTFRVYGTYTGSTNFERLNIGYNATATAYQIGTEKGSVSGTARALELQTDATTRMYVHPTNGRVGIGTTAPDQLLHVNGSIKAYSTLQFQVNGVVANTSTAGNQSLTLIGSNGTPNGFIELRPSSSINSTGEYTKITGGPNGATEVARFLGSGNVGIGTSSPASRLTVTGGDAEVTDSASGLIIKAPNGTRYRVTVDNSGVLTTTALP